MDASGHVGDRHHEPATPWRSARSTPRRRNRAASSPSMGDEPEAAQVLAAFDVRLTHFGRQRRRLPLNRLGPRRRQLVDPDGHVDLHSGQHPIAEHLLDHADRRMAPGSVVR